MIIVVIKIIIKLCFFTIKITQHVLSASSAEATGRGSDLTTSTSIDAEETGCIKKSIQTMQKRGKATQSFSLWCVARCVMCGNVLCRGGA